MNSRRIVGSTRQDLLRRGRPAFAPAVVAVTILMPFSSVTIPVAMQIWRIGRSKRSMHSATIRRARRQSPSIVDPARLIGRSGSRGLESRVTTIEQFGEVRSNLHVASFSAEATPSTTTCSSILRMPLRVRSAYQSCFGRPVKSRVIVVARDLPLQ